MLKSLISFLKNFPTWRKDRIYPDILLNRLLFHLRYSLFSSKPTLEEVLKRWERSPCGFVVGWYGGNPGGEEALFLEKVISSGGVVFYFLPSEGEDFFIQETGRRWKVYVPRSFLSDENPELCQRKWLGFFQERKVYYHLGILSDLSFLPPLRFLKEICGYRFVPSSSLLPEGREKGSSVFSPSSSWSYPQKIYDLYPKISIIVPTSASHMAFLSSLHLLYENTHYPHREFLVVVDRDIHFPYHLPGEVRLVRNSSEKGFSGGVNTGFFFSTGEYLFILHDDLFVPPGWSAPLLLTLERGERVGGVAPMVSNIYNEQRSPFPLYDVNLWGSRRKGRNDFLTPFPVQSLAFPCVGFGRRVLGEVGILDERFPLGFFADEDFSLRIIQAGYKLYCDPRVYVFHIGSASIEGEKNWIQFYRSARALFEKKWGIPYKPKRYRLFHPYR